MEGRTGHHGNRRLIRAGSRTTRPSLTSAPRPVTTGRAAPLAERRRICMDLETAIQAFGSAGHDLPHEVLQWTLDHWDEVAPELLGMLERFTSGADRSDEAARAVFFILHLAGERQDTRVFPLLCRLARDGEAFETEQGDDITTTLTPILISIYDGDLDTLKGVIEAAEADEFVRAGALEVLAYLTATGRIPREQKPTCSSFMTRCSRSMRALSG